MQLRAKETLYSSSVYLYRALVSSMSLAMAVLKEKVFRSWSTALMVLWSTRFTVLSSSVLPTEGSSAQILFTSLSTLSRYLATDLIPPSFHGPPSTYANPNPRYILKASEPYLEIYSSGDTTLPLDLLIFSPSGPRIVPWCVRERNGSSKERYPISRKAFTKKRA